MEALRAYGSRTGRRHHHRSTRSSPATERNDDVAEGGGKSSRSAFAVLRGEGEFLIR